MKPTILLTSLVLLAASALPAQEPRPVVVESLKVSPALGKVPAWRVATAAEVSSGQLVIRVEDEWKRLWQDAWVVYGDPPAAPRVDFNRFSVVRVVRGLEPGDSVALEGLRIEVREAVMTVRTWRVCPPLPALEVRMLFVMVPRLPDAVRIVEREDTAKTCSGQ